MIAKDSKSYPYLAIAQQHNKLYAEVLKYADEIKGKAVKPPYADWRLEVWMLNAERFR